MEKRHRIFLILRWKKTNKFCEWQLKKRNQIVILCFSAKSLCNITFLRLFREMNLAFDLLTHSSRFETRCKHVWGITKKCRNKIHFRLIFLRSKDFFYEGNWKFIVYGFFFSTSIFKRKKNSFVDFFSSIKLKKKSTIVMKRRRKTK